MVLIPISDQAPRRTVPFVNYLLIAANIGAFFYLVLNRGPEGYARVVEVHGLVPAQWTPLQFLTSMFLHGGLAHLFGNLLFLWIAGDNVEDQLGHVGYPIFYVACGVAAGAMHLLTSPGSSLPCIGASGAISGVLGAYLVFFPKSRIRFLFWFVTFKAPSWLAIGVWLVLQALLAWQQTRGAVTQVAVWAHLGGFAVGFAVALLLRLIGRPRGDARN